MRRLRPDGKNFAACQFWACDSSTFVVLLWVSTELRRRPTGHREAGQAVHPPRPYDPDCAARVVELARGGLTHAQIAVEIGASLADFEAWSSQHDGFAVALADADTAAVAYWDDEACAALKTGKPFRANLWAKFMALRFGRPGHSSRRTEKVVAKPVVLARYEIPDNGRPRRTPKRGA
jgi:hypothetical protein